MYFPRGKKLKYLKYIRLRLQDHRRSFEHASVYRIIKYTRCVFYHGQLKNELVTISFAQHYQFTLATSMSLVCVCVCTRNVYPSSNHFTSLLR